MVCVQGRVLEPQNVLYGPHTFSNCVAYCTAFNASGRKLGHTFHRSQIDLVKLDVFQRIEQYLVEWHVTKLKQSNSSTLHHTGKDDTQGSSRKSCKSWKLVRWVFLGEEKMALKIEGRLKAVERFTKRLESIVLQKKVSHT